MDELTDDQLRLAFIATLMDGIGNIDLHELAGEYAYASSGPQYDNPSDYDYYRAVCDAIDAARSSDSASAESTK